MQLKDSPPGKGLAALACAGLLAFGIAGFLLLERTRPARAIRREAAVEPVHVAVIEARPRPETEWVVAYGRCSSPRDAVIRSRVPGDVVWMHPDLSAGSRLTTDTIVLRLDATDARAALDAEAARLEESRAGLALVQVEHDHLEERRRNASRSLEAAEGQLERIEGLIGRGGATSAARDDQTMRAVAARETLLELDVRIAGRAAELERARARVAQAEALSAQSRQRLDRHAVRTPFSGTLLERMVSLGSSVEPGTPLFRLVDPETLEARLALPAGSRESVAPGALLRLRLEPDGPVVWSGTVARIDPSVDEATQTVGVHARLSPASAARASAPASLIPGSFVVGEVAVRVHPRAVVLPRSAFAGGVVRLVDPDPNGRTGVVRELRPRSPRLLTDRVILPEGPPAGSLVVISDPSGIAPGSRVRLPPHGRESSLEPRESSLQRSPGQSPR